MGVVYVCLVIFIGNGGLVMKWGRFDFLKGVDVLGNLIVLCKC